MSHAPLQAFVGGFQAEMLHLRRSPLFVFLTVIQAVTFLFLVSLFGLTGSSAPVALVCNDPGAYARRFIDTLATTHHSFNLRVMDPAAATAALHHGEIVGILTIPENFSKAALYGREVATLRVDVDNVNTDMTTDVQRGLPSAIVRLARELDLPDIRVHVAEQDLISHDTGYIAYLVVSGLVLNAFVIAGILSATAVAREFENGTAGLLRLAPVPAFYPLVGRAAATTVLAEVAMLAPLASVVCGYHILPRHPAAAIGVLLFCTPVFSCLGIVLGALLKRTVPVASLIMGLSLPLYVCSGALEPERFDGNRLWIAGHFSPVYYAVDLLESAFHGLQVTPESSVVNWMALGGWMVGLLALAILLLWRRSR
jgi:ABC-type multidrug transport system permease subunit